MLSIKNTFLNIFVKKKARYKLFREIQQINVIQSSSFRRTPNLIKKKKGSFNKKKYEKIKAAEKAKMLVQRELLKTQIEAFGIVFPLIKGKTMRIENISQLVKMYSSIDRISHAITYIRNNEVNTFKKLIGDRLFHNGPKSLVFYIKMCKTVLLKFFAGDCPESIKSIPGVMKTTKRGFPSSLYFLRGIIQNNESLSELFSLLNTYKVLISNSDLKELDLSSIKNKPNNKNVNKGIKSLDEAGSFDQVAIYLGLTENTLTVENSAVIEYIMMSKGGPNGPAILNCHKELFVHENLDISKKYFSGEILENISELKGYFEKDSTNYKTSCVDSKLTSFPEKGLKVRTVAIADYWTQLRLSNMIANFNNILEKTFSENDCTFNQAKGIELIAKAISNDKCIRSIDLSNATDRIPSTLNKYVIKRISNEEFSEDWITLVTKRDFAVGSGKVMKKIKYGTGTPMGLKSTFSIIALTLHYVVHMSYLKAYLFSTDEYISADRDLMYDLLKQTKRFTDYAILGDDIVIFDSKVSQEFLHFIEGFGIEISKQKSFLNSYSVGEFASRNLVKISKDTVNEHLRGFNQSDFISRNDLSVPLFSEDTDGDSKLNNLAPEQRKNMMVKHALLIKEAGATDFTGLPTNLLFKLKQHPHMTVTCLRLMVCRGYSVNYSIKFLIQFLTGQSLSFKKLTCVKLHMFFNLVYNIERAVFNCDFDITVFDFDGIDTCFSTDSFTLVNNHIVNKSLKGLFKIPIVFNDLFQQLPSDHNFVVDSNKFFDFPECHPLNMVNANILKIYGSDRIIEEINNEDRTNVLELTINILRMSGKVDPYLERLESLPETGDSLYQKEETFQFLIRFLVNDMGISNDITSLEDLEMKSLERSDSVTINESIKDNYYLIIDSVIKDINNILFISINIQKLRLILKKNSSLLEKSNKKLIDNKTKSLLTKVKGSHSSDFWWLKILPPKPVK